MLVQCERHVHNWAIKKQQMCMHLVSKWRAKWQVVVAVVHRMWLVVVVGYVLNVVVLLLLHWHYLN